MTETSKTVVFFGSGPVAAKSLDLLVQDFVIEAVITKPRPAHHRGEYPVLDIADKHNLPLLTVSGKNELSDLFIKKSFASPLGVVIDFGIIMDHDVIERFPFGIVNSHFSLLPRWRGADPISFAILSGDKQTGVSLMLINDKLDEGQILAQAKFDLSDKITTPELTDNLIELSHQTLIKTLSAYLSGEIPLIPQTGTPTYSRKLTKQDGILDFNKSAQMLAREVRAFMNWPRSRTNINGVDIIVTSAHVGSGNDIIGKIWHEGQSFGFFTSEEILIIDKLIPSGKKDMPAEAFLAGYKLN
jgi:methionyl-tRNA formyltransferase